MPAPAPAPKPRSWSPAAVLAESVGRQPRRTREHPRSPAPTKYRRPLLEAGAELYELRHDAAARPDYETPPVHSEHLVLHTKSIVVDREKVFVGSLNLDPRAVYINSEMGLLVEDPVLAERLLAWFDTLITPDNSWKVGLDERDKLFWESSAGRVHRQPAKSWGEHVGDFFYGLILPESQL